MTKELKYLAMDADQESIVIFELDRGVETNLYLWVDVDMERVRVTTITGIYSYMNHTASPLYVKDDNKKLIDEAFAIFEKVSVDQIKEDIHKCLKDVDSVCENRPGWADEIEKMENGAAKEIEEARKSESGLWS